MTVSSDPAHSSHGHAAHDHGDHTHDGSFQAIDPVCGMKVDTRTAKHRDERDGQTYYFCSAGCKTRFQADPLKYLKPTAVQQQPAAPGTIYTCPMHPEIRQEGPGSCPICGMALEPEMPSVDAGPNAELVDMMRRFWIGLVLAVPVFLLEMGGHVLNLHWLSPQTSNWVQFVLATPVVLWAGWPFFERG
ncbi:MAG: cation transporting P-type ATPase, partial [Rhizobium sp.]|nr:cation transporting P-type ATPase [Rhizobium sp.]